MEGKFSCSYCAHRSQTLISHADHQKIHMHDKNFKFLCGYPTCHYSASTSTALSHHLRRDHIQEKQEVVAGGSTETWSCSAEGCGIRKPSLKDIHSHIVKDHLKTKDSSQQGSVVRCPVKSCDRSIKFNSIQNFRSHFSKFHQGWKKSFEFSGKVFESAASDLSSFQGEPSFSADCGDVVESMEVDADVAPTPESPSRPAQSIPSFDSEGEDAYTLIAKFYLYLEGQLLLPSSTIQKICDHLTVVSEIVQMTVKKALMNELKNFGLSSDDSLNITTNALSADALYCSHHKTGMGPSLTSDFLRHKYFIENFSYIEPTEYFVGSDRADEEGLQYVPIAKSLQVMLQDSTVATQVEESFLVERESPAVYKNYTDGVVCIEKHSHVKERVDIILFSDAFSCTNPLGSAKKKHNLEGTYFTLGNLKPQNRSQLDGMNLVSLTPKHLLKKYGYDQCFAPLVRDLKQLVDEGIEFQGRRVAVALMFICGDNLGQHQLGGLLESFSGEYFCRFCPIKKSEFQENPLTLKPLRTVRHFKKAQLKINSGTLDHYKGIKADCAFNGVDEAFHVGDPRLPPCVAHDFFLGVGEWGLASMISYFVKKRKWFTYNLLNRRIQSFQCKDIDAPNKPACVPEQGGRLGGHAAQNWALIRLLPLILQDDLIKDPEDSIWKLYLLLKSICEIICSPIISTAQVNQLKEQVEEYIDGMKTFSKMKPKHHFLLHYHQLIPLFGPLIHLFTLRFESKHQFFKKVIKATKNFINVARTMILYHQMHLTYLSTGALFLETVNDLKPKPLKLEELTSDDISVITSDMMCLPSMVSHAVTVNGLKYKVGQWLILGMINDQTLSIGKIKLVVPFDAEVKFLFSTHSASYLPSFGVYCINEDVVSAQFVSNLKIRCHSVQPVYEFRNSLCFSLKHSVSGNFLI